MLKLLCHKVSHRPTVCYATSLVCLPRKGIPSWNTLYASVLSHNRGVYVAILEHMASVCFRFVFQLSCVCVRGALAGMAHRSQLMLSIRLRARVARRGYTVSGGTRLLLLIED